MQFLKLIAVWFSRRNVTALSNGEKKLTLYPDPELEKFEGGVLYFQAKNDYLTMTVRSETNYPQPLSNLNIRDLVIVGKTKAKH